ncbi:uncharacterized mitochondrial protein-like protein [Tanacetum coccineum]
MMEDSSLGCDLFVTGTSLDLINEFKKRMSSLFEMPDLGKLTYYLGIEFSQGKDCMEIKQERYAKKILKEAGMEDCNDFMSNGTGNQVVQKMNQKLKLLYIKKCSHNVDIDDGRSTTRHAFYLGTSPITCLHGAHKIKITWCYLRVKLSSWQPLQLRISNLAKGVICGSDME